MEDSLEMPVRLPESLEYCKEAANQKELFALLLKNPKDLIDFLIFVLPDVGWSSRNSDFIERSLDYVTIRFFEDSLFTEEIQELADAIRRHENIYRPVLANNLTIELKDGSLQMNTLMFGTLSPFFQDLIKVHCRSQTRPTLHFKDYSYTDFGFIYRYMYNGDLTALWQKDRDEVVHALVLAEHFGVKELSDAAQNVIIQYVNEESLWKYLLESQKQKWLLVRQACIDLFNSKVTTVKLSAGDTPQELAMEILSFREETMQDIEKLKEVVTELVVGGSFAEDANFLKTIGILSHLKGIDIGSTRSWYDSFLKLPFGLENLSLRSCVWLGNIHLQAFVMRYPRLTRLCLASDTRITYVGWAELQKLHSLKMLDLSRCIQITDQDFSIIMKACQGIHELDLEGCSRLSQKSFAVLASGALRLIRLNVSRTELDDEGLIEIAEKCRTLVYIDIKRCKNVTDRGVLEFLKLAPSIKEIHLARTSTTESGIEEMRSRYPRIKLL